MKNKTINIIIIIFVFLMLFISCSPEVTPVIVSKDPTTWVEASYAEPETLDPSLSYESAGGEIIQNTLDNLIFFKKDSAIEFVPMLATEVPSQENGGISADGKTYIFKIREGVTFHDGTPMTVEDVAFTFHRNILAGGTNSPQWMMIEPVYGAGLIDIAEVVAAAAEDADLLIVDAILENSYDALLDDRAAMAETYDAATLEAVCEDLKSRIVADEVAGTVTFNLAQGWSPFLSTLAGGGWGGIQSKSWVSENGGWNGDCTSWVPYYGWTSEEFGVTRLGKRTMGTGPYMFESWNEGEEIILKANKNYWMDAPLWDGAPVGPAVIQTIIIKQAGNFSARLAKAQAGDTDNILVDSSKDWLAIDKMVAEEAVYTDWMAGLPMNVLDETQPFRKITDIPGVNARTDIGFQFQINIDGGNTLIGSGKLDGDGIPPTFFQDTHIRRAFSYCFNYDLYLEKIHLGEGSRAPTLMLPGMSGYEENTPQYTYDIEKCKAELEASYWTTCTEIENVAEKADAAIIAFVEGDSEAILEDLEAVAASVKATADSCESQPVNEVGFRFSVIYDSGNDKRQAIAELLQDGMQKAGEQYLVEVVGLPWTTYDRYINMMRAPVFTIDWISDYNDTHNWLSAFTCSYYPFKQGFPEIERREFCDIGTEGVQIVDPAERDIFYKEVFNKKYHEYAPGILLFNLKQRAYQPRYVRGWYTNVAYSNKWYYSLSKE